LPCLKSAVGRLLLRPRRIGGNDDVCICDGSSLFGRLGVLMFLVVGVGGQNYTYLMNWDGFLSVYDFSQPGLRGEECIWVDGVLLAWRWVGDYTYMGMNVGTERGI
jgi:hypothetical protein